MIGGQMVGWYHWLNGHEFEQTPGHGEGQGSLVCCSPWSQKELDRTEWLNNRSYSTDKRQAEDMAGWGMARTIGCSCSSISSSPSSLLSVLPKGTTWKSLLALHSVRHEYCTAGLLCTSLVSLPSHCSHLPTLLSLYDSATLNLYWFP